MRGPHPGDLGVTAESSPGRRRGATVSTPSPEPHARWTLIYDGQCRFCLGWIALIRRWDRAGHVNLVPLQDGAAWAGLGGLSRQALETAAHLVGPRGATYVGAAAAGPLLTLLPGGRVLAAPLALPGAERIAAAVYRWVARRRHRLGCGSQRCHRHD